MKNNKKLTIHHLFWYFLIFSILGLIIETIYCYISSGTLESRKGLIWGPFCPVYGVCGAVLIYILYKLNCKGIIKLFSAGFIFGSIAEYLLSYGLEAVYGMRFWNYEYLTYNLNGRISLIFSIYWGILSIILIKFAKPLIDKMVNKINPNKIKIIDLGIFIFLFIDCLVTIWGIQTYQNRVIYNKVYRPIEGNIFSEVRGTVRN